MRFKKPKGISDPISRLRKEENWNFNKRKEILTKNKGCYDCRDLWYP